MTFTIAKLYILNINRSQNPSQKIKWGNAIFDFKLSRSANHVGKF